MSAPTHGALVNQVAYRHYITHGAGLSKQLQSVGGVSYQLSLPGSEQRLLLRGPTMGRCALGWFCPAVEK